MARMTTSKPSAQVRAALFERLAERLQQAGALHPLAATIALVARGDRGLTQLEFASELGLATETIGSIEAGEVHLAETLDVLGEATPPDVKALLARTGLCPD